MARKNPFVGGLLNLLIPGLSNGYVGRWGRAILQFISSMAVLLALLFTAVLLERTDPPWPDGLALAVALGLYLLIVFLAGVITVRRYHAAHASRAAGRAKAGSQALAPVLSGLVLALCLLSVAAIWLGGLLNRDQWEPLIETRLPALASFGVEGNPPLYSRATTPARTATPQISVLAATRTPRSSVSLATRTPGSAASLPTETPEPPSQPRAIVTHETLNVRAGPGTAYDKVGQLRQGDEVAVTARNKDGSWVAVTLEDGTEGWVYADYTELDTPKDAIPVAQKIPAPPTPAEPTATLTVDEQIAKVAKGQHGTLPEPGAVGGVDAGGQAEVTIINDTPYVLTILVGSPNSISISIEACATCKRYFLMGPMSCPEEGRPRKTIRLNPGNSEVVARVSDRSVAPFYGRWNLQANTGYFNCFYIVTKTQ